MNFILGCVTGSIITFVIMGCCIAAKEGDKKKDKNKEE